MIAKAQNGKMLKFLTIKPSGFNLSEICHGILYIADLKNHAEKHIADTQQTTPTHTPFFIKY